MMSKYSVGVYSTTPTGWKPDRSGQLQDEADNLPRVAVTERADGPATIETYSVRYDWPTRTGIVIGRLPDASRFLATSEDDDLVALLAEGEPLGAQITVCALDYGNRCSLR